MENQLFKVQTKANGWNAARSVTSMKISNVASEVNSFVVMLGSDKFTEIYFKTESGNIYRVIRAVSGSWVLENSREKPLYYFTQTELHYSKISVGKPFYYSKAGRTTKVTEIIAVCTGKNYLKLNAPITHIKNVFQVAVKF